MGCSISYERGEHEAEIIEGHETSSPYPPGCNLWCYMRPFPRQLDHEQARNNEPVDILLSDPRPVSQATPPQEAFATEWQRTTEGSETGWNRDVAQLAHPEPVAGIEQSHQVSSRTHLPDLSAHVALDGLDNGLLPLRGEYGSRQRSLSPGSQLEVDTVRRQNRRIRQALENSPSPAQASRLPIMINDPEQRARRLRFGRASRLTSPAPPGLQSDIDNHRQRPNQEPGQRVSTPHPHYPNLPPPVYSVRAPE